MLPFLTKRSLSGFCRLCASLSLGSSLVLHSHLPDQEEPPHAIGEDVRDHVLKYARTMRTRPYYFTDAANDLEEWVSGNRVLEAWPVVSDVVVAAEALLSHGVSAEGDFVNTVADELVRGHNMSWPMALQHARNCWQRLLPRYRPHVGGVHVVPHGQDEDTPQMLHLDPLRHH